MAFSLDSSGLKRFLAIDTGGNNAYSFRYGMKKMSCLFGAFDGESNRPSQFGDQIARFLDKSL
ncbi:MAG: hypothetical protein K2P68_06505 [Sphingomonas sp.]|nr:hypothetical protein [Sphingomonas sp.]